MAIPTTIEFDDFYKAVQILAVRKGFECKPYKGKKASATCFQFFKEGNAVPFNVFCVHRDHHRGVIYSDDLKKACRLFEIDKNAFESFIKDGFK